MSLNLPFEVPFVNHLGARLTRLETNLAHIELTIEPWMRNSWGVAHGGIVMTLLDVAMAVAGRPLSADLASSNRLKPSGNVTIEMKTSFMAPARGHLRAEGVCIKRTATMAFCEATLYSAGDEAQASLADAWPIAARASGTFKAWGRRTQTTPNEKVNES